MKKGLFLLLIFNLLFSWGNQDAVLYKDAKKLYKSGSYLKAFELFQKIPSSSQLAGYIQYYSLRSGVLAKQFAGMKDVVIDKDSVNTPFKSELETLEKAISYFNGAELTNDEKLKCGDFFASVGNYSNAELFYNHVADTPALNIRKKYGLISVYFGQKNKAKALKRIGQQSYSAKKIYYQGVYAWGNRRIVKYKELVEKFPESSYSATAADYLYRHYYSKKSYNLALKYLRFLENKSWYSSMASFEKGYIYYRLGKYNYALVNFNKVNDGYYKPACLFWEANIQKKRGRNNERRRLLELILEKYPFSFYAYRTSKILNKRPKINYQDLQPINESNTIIPQRVQLLVKAEAYDDLFYELQTFYKEDKGLWEYAVDVFREHDEYFYLLKANKYLKNKYYSYPLAYNKIVEKEAVKYDLSKYLILAVMREESHFKKLALSSSNAKGLMQFMDATAAETARKMGVRNYDLYDPSYNIKFGAHYLDYLIKRFGIEKGIMAYNCGPGNLQRRGDHTKDMDSFLENFPLPETRRYVKKVMSAFWTYSLLYGGE